MKKNKYRKIGIILYGVAAVLGVMTVKLFTIGQHLQGKKVFGIW